MGVSESDLKGESERDRAEIEETLKTLQGESK
ncbi:cytochrome c-type biogenesis protein CcmE [Actinobacillus equuli]|nr:cytochrome c-type biogenesis protein CcmE [Actinobacillus equuli]